MKIKQLSVFLENKKGCLLSAVEVLAKNKINIRALSLADTSDFGILRLIVDQPEKGREVLADSGIVVRVNDVLALSVSDTPGGTLAVLQTLAEKDIAVEYMYACVGKKDGKAYMVVRAESPDLAEELLTNAGFMPAALTDELKN